MDDSGPRRPGDGGWQRRRILAFLQDFTRREGYSPSYRQIGEKLGIAVSTVSYHVALLKADGSLHREPGQPRTITWPGRPSPAVEGGGAEIPLIGQVAAGDPLHAEEAVEQTFVGRLRAHAVSDDAGDCGGNCYSRHPDPFHACAHSFLPCRVAPRSSRLRPPRPAAA